MRMSEGTPHGRFVELYNPDMFNEGEEVIVFARRDFERMYTSLYGQIDYINKTYLHLDREKDWMLMGYWPEILERIYILDLNMDLIFKNESLQCYLDTYLFDIIRNANKEVVRSEKQTLNVNKVSNLNLLF